MNFKIINKTAYPLAEISLNRGEEVRIERGCMVYHHGGVVLEGKRNSNDNSILKAIGRSLVSNESFYITTARGENDGAKLGIAPSTPGDIRELEVGNKQWRINDGAFLACDNSVIYNIKKQSLGRAIFGGTGSLFIMETAGQGSMLLNCFGDLIELECTRERPLIVDNMHVVAWSADINYNIQVASGIFGFKTGEGLVNEFVGNGTVYIQTRNISSMASEMSKFITKG